MTFGWTNVNSGIKADIEIQIAVTGSARWLVGLSLVFIQNH